MYKDFVLHFKLFVKFCVLQKIFKTYYYFLDIIKIISSQMKMFNKKKFLLAFSKAFNFQKIQDNF